jgi:hypothetical protein
LAFVSFRGAGVGFRGPMLAFLGWHWPSRAGVGLRGLVLAGVGLQWPSLAFVSFRGAGVGFHGPMLAFLSWRWPSWVGVGRRWPALAFVGFRGPVSKGLINKNINIPAQTTCRVVWALVIPSLALTIPSLALVIPSPACVGFPKPFRGHSASGHRWPSRRVVQLGGDDLATGVVVCH